MTRHDLPADDPAGPPSVSDAGRTAPSLRRKRHPAVLEEQARRVANVQLRIADRITAAAGSMQFVYFHVALFAVWMVFLESRPWPTLTLIVSLEAIFLSAFVMIGQNRQAAFQQAKADHNFNEQELELNQHAADQGDPPAHDRASQAAYRPPHPAGEVTMTVLRCSPRARRSGP